MWSLCCPLFWAWDPAAESQMPQPWSLVFPSVQAPWKLPTAVPWALCGARCRGSTQDSRAMEQGCSRTCSTVLLQWPGDAAVAWRCCPDWDAFPEHLSQLSEAVSSGEYNWSSKSPWCQLLNCRSCTLTLRELPLGKAFFPTTDFSETWSGPLVSSFTLYWLLLHRSKWLRSKG